MSWSNLFVIFRREVLDQLRDRRTLFMIFVFPILLYPILGYGIIQATAAREKKPRIVVVVGAEYLPIEEPLLNPAGDGFNPRLFDSTQDTSPLLVQPESLQGPWGNPERREQAVRGGTASAVMVIPPDLPRQFREKNDVEIPILYRSVDEPSQNTYFRLREAPGPLEARNRGGPDQEGQPAPGLRPADQVKGRDVATVQEVQGNTWSLIFPFLLVMMSLTGAFYPAVDLCAGEKERGTMETLLISPATRAEIVLGKFLTVMLASVTTAILNLVSMGLTGIVLAKNGASLAMEPGQRAAATAGLAPPTVQSALWMLLLLIPLAAFFSAVCVALAVLARSMKEGQYYMTPLYLVCLPLIFLTLIPETKLNLFYSLVPITGVALLLRALIMGDYATGGRYFLPVLVPTLVYAWMALRWAIDQFQSEEVLFREAERFNLGVWLKHLIRDREPMPTGGQAVLCFALILSASWFLMEYMAIQGIGGNLAAVAAGQFLILFPPLIMAVMLTSSPRRTLRLYWPAPRYFLLAIVFPLALNPLVNQLGHLVEQWFPISSDHQAVAQPDHVRISQPVGQRGRLRAHCRPFARSSPSAVSFSPGWNTADGHGRRSPVGTDVRVPPRAHEPVPATFQRDPAGHRAGIAGGPQPQHLAGNSLSFSEQRPGHHPGPLGPRPGGRRTGLLALSQSAGRSLSWVLDRAELAGLDSRFSCTSGSWIVPIKRPKPTEPRPSSKDVRSNQDHSCK